jgi:hypothetical protein
MRSAWFTRTEVERMIRSGDMTDAKSIAAFALLLPHHAQPPGRGQAPVRTPRSTCITTCAVHSRAAIRAPESRVTPSIPDRRSRIRWRVCVAHQVPQDARSAWCSA